MCAYIIKAMLIGDTLSVKNERKLVLRHDGRQPHDLRDLKISRDFLSTAEGSVLIEIGGTKVLCTASIEESVPRFLRGKNSGWITAEYGMIPRSTKTRMDRESVRGKQKGRTQEIQRLIGRSLRAAVDLSRLGERTVFIDCDVIQADGGTRTASITGAWVALNDAMNSLVVSEAVIESPVTNQIAAVSVGIVNNIPVLDLDYVEDSNAQTDMNVVMNESGLFIEIQGTAEHDPFSSSELNGMLELAKVGIQELLELQTKS